MNNRVFIILIASLLLISVTLGMTYKQSFNFFEKQLNNFSNAVDLLTGIGSTFHDRVIYFRDINSKSFGTVNIGGLTYDIGEYIKDNFLPDYLYKLAPTLNVTVTLSPKLYDASLNIYKGIFNSKQLLTFKNCLRYNINIYGTNDGDIINTTINMLYGDATSSTGSTLKTYLVFDVVSDKYEYAYSYASFDEFIQDQNNLEWNILSGGTVGNESTGYVRTLIDFVSETDKDIIEFFN